MKRNFIPLPLALFLISSFISPAMAGSGGLGVFDRWFGESTDYPLVYEQYLHQLRVAESELSSLTLGKTVSRSRLDEVLHRIQTLSALLDQASAGQSDLSTDVIRRYKTEKTKVKQTLETVVVAHEDIAEWHRLIKSMKKDGSELLQASDKLTVEATREGMDGATVHTMARQEVLLQRVIANLNWLTHSLGTEEDVIAVDRIGRDLYRFTKTIEGLQSGDKKMGLKAVSSESLQSKLEAHSVALRNGLAGKVGSLLKLAPEIFKYKMDLKELAHSIDRMEAVVNTVN